MLEGVLEGILFVCGDDGISKDRLLEILEINSEELCLTYSDIIGFHGLQSRYEGDDERHIKQMDICHLYIVL